MAPINLPVTSLNKAIRPCTVDPEVAAASSGAMRKELNHALGLSEYDFGRPHRCAAHQLRKWSVARFWFELLVTFAWARSKSEPTWHCTLQSPSHTFAEAD
jgi:hypothetical protein